MTHEPRQHVHLCTENRVNWVRIHPQKLWQYVTSFTLLAIFYQTKCLFGARVLVCGSQFRSSCCFSSISRQPALLHLFRSFCAVYCVPCAHSTGVICSPAETWTRYYDDVVLLYSFAFILFNSLRVCSFVRSFVCTFACSFSILCSTHYITRIKLKHIALKMAQQFHYSTFPFVAIPRNFILMKCKYKFVILARGPFWKGTYVRIALPQISILYRIQAICSALTLTLTLTLRCGCAVHAPLKCFRQNNRITLTFEFVLFRFGVFFFTIFFFFFFFVLTFFVVVAETRASKYNISK